MAKYIVGEGEFLGLYQEGDVVKCRVLFRSGNDALLLIPGEDPFSDCSSLMFARKHEDGWRGHDDVEECYLNLSIDDEAEIKGLLRGRKS